jgi:lipopolysaccharide export LptBFGC system permease protein LptF
LFSALFCLGMLARTQEITAMRANGISVQRIALPLVILSLFICQFSFAGRAYRAHSARRQLQA